MVNIAPAVVEQTDVVVIGGGPAGATVSTLVAQKGYRVALYERDKFPRFHVGESLIPETYWTLKRLNMLDKMKSSSFVKKRSVQFVTSNGKASAPFYFEDNNPHECSQTWQVVRSEFDLLMLNNAREHGVDAHEGARVMDVLFEEDRAVGIRVRTEDGVLREVRAKVVVDASGQSGMLMNRLKLRTWDPVLNKGAIWTYWQNCHRDMGRDEGATVILQTTDRKGWFWYIPLHDNRASVGIVAPFDDLFKGRGSHEQTYQEEVAKCAGVAERLAGADRVAGYFATRDFSYRCDRVAGPGWVLVGDAFGFLDPLYSSGLMLALKSGEMAADGIVDALAADDYSEARLGSWGPTLNRGIDRIRRLVCEFYEGFNFGAFVRNYPQMKGRITDLLIGDFFSEKVDEVWAPMETTYAEGRMVPVSWNSGTDPEIAANKLNELVLPDGARP
ncbi:MAG: NAD(P)/FAD-dependent oxidoreductase [Planctomycetota bacterium]